MTLSTKKMPATIKTDVGKKPKGNDKKSGMIQPAGGKKKPK